jgi:hypothetical protein
VGWAKPGQATDGPSEIVPGSALRPLDGGPAGSTTYEYWTTVWCSNGGHLKFQDLGVSSEDRGQLPQATMPHAPLRDLVFVHGSQEETLFGPDPADEPWQNINHYDVADPAQHLIDLITYCKERWGSTLFYVDSCVFVNRPPVCSHRPLSLQRHGDPDCGCRILEPYTDVLSADAYRRILEAHPDVLVMPENQCTNVHPYAAPFDEGGHHGVRQTPRRVKTQWPGAFTTINISTDPQNVTADALDGYVEAVRQGDILMFQQWDYLQEAVQEVYRRAGQVPEVRIEAPAHGATFPAGRGVSIVATAADRDGRIAAVEFFRSNPVEGRVKLGITTAPPYAFTWQDPPAGRHVLSVKATDDAGLSIWAASVVVTVTGDERLRGR